MLLGGDYYKMIMERQYVWKATNLAHKICLPGEQISGSYCSWCLISFRACVCTFALITDNAYRLTWWASHWPNWRCSTDFELKMCGFSYFPYSVKGYIKLCLMLLMRRANTPQMRGGNDYFDLSCHSIIHHGQFPRTLPCSGFVEW
jgi:hypothetical protein